MKIFKILFAALLLSVSFVACKKDNVTVPETAQQDNKPNYKNIVTGIWVGQYVTTTRSAPVYLSMKIKPGGTLDLLDETNLVVGKGSWSLADIKFTALYIINGTQQSYVVSGDLEFSPERLGGDLKFGNDYPDTGSWFMDKIQ